ELGPARGARAGAGPDHQRRRCRRRAYALHVLAPCVTFRLARIVHARGAGHRIPGSPLVALRARRAAREEDDGERAPPGADPLATAPGRPESRAADRRLLLLELLRVHLLLLDVLLLRSDPAPERGRERQLYNRDVRHDDGRARWRWLVLRPP